MPDVLASGLRKIQLHHASILVVGLLFTVPAGTGFAQDGGLAADVGESAEGYFQLRWSSTVPLRLVESRSSDFSTTRIAYQGADTARVESGKPDGIWYYRLENPATGAVVGAPVSVTVAHHPLSRAVGFFSVGAIVFVATLGLIVFGSRSAAA